MASSLYHNEIFGFCKSETIKLNWASNIKIALVLCHLKN